MEPIADPMSLADWRRRVMALYAEVRSTPEPESGWRHWRETRDHLFGNHAQSPLKPRERPAFRGLPLFDYRHDLRYTVSLIEFRETGERGRGAKTETWDIGADGAIKLQPFARTEGLAPDLGGELTVFWVLGYGGGVFLPFTDATNGRETYGGGRYLLDGIKGADLGLTADGRLICDFNFAYNPSCAYNDAWVCPLPPAENRLSAVITAGERIFWD
jgi:hypothetical protein